MRYRGILQPCNDGAHGIVLVLRVRRRGTAGVACDLQLMRLQHSPHRVEKETRILWRPKIHVHRMQSVHVFALARRVGRREMPLRHVLVGACISILALELVDCECEQARVLVCLFNLDCVQLCATTDISFLHCVHGDPRKDLRPAKASWLGVPAWFAISMRPLWRMGLW